MNICAQASEGEPGVDSGSSWFQDADVLVSGFALVGSPRELDWEVYDGSLAIDGETFDMVPVPFERKGRIRLEILGDGGGKLVVSGSAIRVEATETPGAVERF